MEALFFTVNAIALFGWVLLLLIPKHGLTKALVHNMLLPGILCAVYAAFLVNEVGFGAASGEGGFSSIDAVQALFAAPNGVLLGWTHFLAFDLFVGAWIYERGAQYSGWVIKPILLATLGFGPLGLLLFLGLRIALPQRSQTAVG